MMKRRLAFASDYDGTLVHGVDTMSPGDVEAVLRFQGIGGLFGACSGRALNCVLEPAEKNGIELDFAVVSTGAVIVANKQVVEKHHLDRTTLGWLLTDYGDVHLGLHTMTRFLVNFGPTSPNQTRVDSLKARLGEEVFAVSINFDDEDQAQEATRRINEGYGGRLSAFQNMGSVDVVPVGCSKGAGLQTIRQALGVDALGGIGDSYNDVPLLDAADEPYTFVESPAEVQGHATRLVGTVAEAIGDFEAR